MCACTVSLLLTATQAVLRGPTADPRTSPAPVRGSAPPRLNRIIRLPGLGGVIDVRLHSIYQSLGGPAGNCIARFDWLDQRVVWRAPVPRGVEPVAGSSAAVICATVLAGGATRNPLLGLDSRTGAFRWKEQAAPSVPIGMVGLTVTGESVFAATSG